MLRHKLRAARYFLSCLVWANLRYAARGFLRGPRSGYRATRQAAGRVYQGFKALATMQGRYRVARLVELCVASGTPREDLAKSPEAALILALWLNDEQRHEEAIALLEPFMRLEPRFAKCFGVRGMAYLGLGKYPEALADLTTCHSLAPSLSRDFNHDLHRAYLHGLRGESDAARKAMADQMHAAGYRGTVDEAVASFLASRLAGVLAPLDLRGSVGVVIGSFHSAVGHAILDPFHFIQLYRHRFDRLILVHPPYSHYTPPTRLAAQILDQYVDQVEVSDHDVLNFAWQSIGELRHGTLTFLVHNYWSLNRMAFQARNTPGHPMAEGRRYMSLPPRMTDRAEALCRRNHLELTKPLVVVHTREHGYHGLRGQKYRNTDVRNYIPALRRLIDLGYQVVRIGDAKMYSVRGEVPGLLELPATDYYDPILDPFLIGRCKFMISCQSGPCSYARAFGKPNLVLNAVYHYTLLPENNELLAFKHYRDAATRRVMGVEEVFKAGGHLFDRTEHFEAAGIEVEDMTPQELLAATEEMLAWLADPALPEAPTQKAFRDLTARYSVAPDPANPRVSPIADYVGYSLPECRLSDAVCKLRPGFMPVPEAAAPARRAA